MLLKSWQCLSQSRDFRPSEARILSTLLKMAKNLPNFEVLVTSNMPHFTGSKQSVT